MIHAITANQPSFRPVEFTSGLNVILAERAEASSRKDTRNGLGKSTLVEIIHFCLGAKVFRGRGLAIPALEEWAFTMEMSVGGDRIKVTRSLATPNIVAVSDLGSDWPGIPATDLMGERSFTQAQWRDFLGRALYSLSESRGRNTTPRSEALFPTSFAGATTPLVTPSPIHDTSRPGICNFMWHSCSDWSGVMPCSGRT